MKRALITGATGCIGRNIVDVLEKDSWEIFVLHRKSSDLSRLKGCKVKTIEADFHDKESIYNAVPENLDAIFHSAANLSHESSHDEEQWKDNVLGTKYLAEAAILKKTNRFIFTSTGATLPYNTKGEEVCPSIKSGYVRTKRLAELELYKMINNDLDFVILHPIIVIGKYDYNNYSKIFQMIKEGKLKGIFDGNFTFCDAEQIANAHLNAFYKAKKCEHYLLGGIYSNWVNLSNTAANLMGVKENVKSIPYPLLKFISYFIHSWAKVSGKKASLTPQVAELVGRGEANYNTHLKTKTKKDLGYDCDNQSIEKMVKSCLDWMQMEAILNEK
jgi:nucleoside-diphosphate-sugar epimerase